jgi:hypothetical protein
MLVLQAQCCGGLTFIVIVFSFQRICAVYNYSVSLRNQHTYVTVSFVARVIVRCSSDRFTHTCDLTVSVVRVSFSCHKATRFY